MPPINSGITEFTQALFGATNTMTNIFDQQMKEKARSDLLNMQANLDIEANRFMLELQNSNDYENWNQRYDEFIKKQGDILQKNSRNQYTATAAKEMLQNYEVNMRKKVETQVFNMGNQDIVRKNNDTEKLIMGNKGITGQDKMNQLSNIANREVLNGLINGDQYEAKLKNYGTNLYLDYYGNMGADLIKVAIQNGKSFDWIENQINGDEFNIELKAVAHGRNTIDDYDSGNAQFTDITHTLDKRAIKSEALKSIKQSYNATVKTMQDQNRTELSEMNTRIEALNTYSERLYAYKAALNKLNNDYQGLALDASVRDHYTNLWKDKIKEIGDTGPNGTGSGSGANSSFDTFFKNQFINYSEMANKGDIESYYDAINVYTEMMKKNFINNNYKENKGLSKEEREELWETDYANRVSGEILQSAAIDKLMKQNFPGLYTKYINIGKDIAANPGMYPKGTQDYVEQFTLDLFMSVNGTANAAELEAEVDKQLNLCAYGKFEKLLKTNNVSKQLGTLEENDVVFTNQYGVEKWAPGTKEKVDSVSKNISQDIYNKFGKNVVLDHYENTLDDKKPIPIFVEADENGNPKKNGAKYKVETIRDKKDDVQGYRVYNPVTGEELKPQARKGGTTWNDWDAQNENEAANKENKAASKLREKEVKQLDKKAQAELEKKVNDTLKQKKLPEDIQAYIKENNINWSELFPAQKKELLKNYYLNN